MYVYGAGAMVKRWGLGGYRDAVIIAGVGRALPDFCHVEPDLGWGLGVRVQGLGSRVVGLGPGDNN